MAKAKSLKKNEVKEVATPLTAETSVASAAPSPAPEIKPKLTKMTRRPFTAPSENLVAMNLDDQIRQLAYLLSERRGFEPGHETEDWLTAEHEVRSRNHQPSA